MLYAYYSVFSLADNIFLKESVKIQERSSEAPVAFDCVFPLKKAMFDGIVVPVPNQIEAYNQTKYGEDLRPAKIYDEKLNAWVKDLSHPYWERESAH